MSSRERKKLGWSAYKKGGLRDSVTRSSFPLVVSTPPHVKLPHKHVSMFRALQKKMSPTKTGTSASSSVPVIHLRLNLDFEATTPCRASPSWTHSSDATEDDDTFSETSTLVDCASSPVNQITTAFQETDPEVQAAIYQEYLACPSTGHDTDDEELDPYNTSWARTPSKRSGSRRSSRRSQSDQGKKGWRIRFRR